MAAEIHLRLYEELNNLLPPDRRKRRSAYPLNDLASVRELLENLAIPENTVELVLVNGTSVEFFFPLHEGDFVNLYPAEVLSRFDLLNTTVSCSLQSILADLREHGDNAK
jgi:uncharacterized protein